jgi:hypothetical protein
MKSLREYIDIIENNSNPPDVIEEWPFGKTASTNASDINKRVFNRPSVDAVKVNPLDVSDFGVAQNELHDFDIAKQHKNADSFSIDKRVNKYVPVSVYDPPNIRRLAAREIDVLKRRWEMWKAAGMI